MLLGRQKDCYFFVDVVDVNLVGGAGFPALLFLGGDNGG